MSRREAARVITANALREGWVVYLTADDRWSRQLSEAELIEDEAHAQIRLLFAAGQDHLIVGAYLADAAQGALGPEPVHFREAFRARGPSNYALGGSVERSDV